MVRITCGVVAVVGVGVLLGGTLVFGILAFGSDDILEAW